MAKRGLQVFWTINQSVESDAKTLTDLGFERFLPRNNYPTALIKALRKYTRGNDRAYRKFNDRLGQVSFGVFVETISHDDIAMTKEVTIRVHKHTGQLTFNVPAGVEFDESALRADYKAGTGSISSEQIRAIVTRYVNRNGGIPMRPTGGIYFFDKRYESGLGKLRKLFEHFGREMQLFEVQLGDDEKTLQAVEAGVGDELFSQIDRIIEEVQKDYTNGTITNRKLQTKREEADTLLRRIAEQEHNLRTRAVELKRRTKATSDLLTTKIAALAGSVTEEGEFAELLRLL